MGSGSTRAVGTTIAPTAHTEAVRPSAVAVPEGLPEPTTAASSGDLATQLAILMARVEGEEKKSAREARTASELREQAAVREQVQALHDQADATRMGGWAQGIAAAAGAGCQIGAQFTAASPAKSFGWHEGFTIGAGAVKDAGPSVGAQFKAAGEDSSARAAGFRALADLEGRRNQHANEDMSAARDALAKAFDVVKKMQAEREESMRAMAQRM